MTHFAQTTRCRDFDERHPVRCGSRRYNQESAPQNNFNLPAWPHYIFRVTSRARSRPPNSESASAIPIELLTLRRTFALYNRKSRTRRRRVLLLIIYLWVRAGASASMVNCKQVCCVDSQCELISTCSVVCFVELFILTSLIIMCMCNYFPCSHINAQEINYIIVSHCILQRCFCITFTGQLLESSYYICSASLCFKYSSKNMRVYTIFFNC
jgi:hypothetical protein